MAKKRGVGCRVIRTDLEGEIRFLVQHGQLCKREPSCKGPQSTCTFFRPEKTDLVIYDALNNELRIRATRAARRGGHWICRRPNCPRSWKAVPGCGIAATMPPACLSLSGIDC